MKRTSVKSSDLKSVGYDAQTTVLEVEFKDDSVYQYSRVPEQVYLELMNAPSTLMGNMSIGRYFARNIKNNRDYSCQKVYPDYKTIRV